MKNVVFCFLLAFGSYGNASVHEFECSLSGADVALDGKIIFQIADLNSSMSLNHSAFTNYDGSQTAFSYRGEAMEWLWLMVVYDEIEELHVDSNGNLVLGIDDISCDVGKLQLYKNNNFRFGYLKLKHNCSGPNTADTYSKVRCKIRKVR